MAIQTPTIDMAQAWVDRAEARLRRFAFFNKADRLVEAASMFECAATEFARTNRGAPACIAWRRAADLYEQGGRPSEAALCASFVEKCDGLPVN
jgi:hypothetical protein